jgi:hypothetical protein
MELSFCCGVYRLPAGGKRPSLKIERAQSRRHFVEA